MCLPRDTQFRRPIGLASRLEPLDRRAKLICYAQAAGLNREARIGSNDRLLNLETGGSPAGSGCGWRSKLSVNLYRRIAANSANVVTFRSARSRAYTFHNWAAARASWA